MIERPAAGQGNTTYDVYLLDHHSDSDREAEEAHIQTLAIPVKAIALDGQTPRPQAIIFVDNTQIGCWNIAGLQVTFENVPNTKPAWDTEDRKKAIELDHFHPNKAKAHKQIATTAHVVIKSGLLATDELQEKEVKGGNPSKSRKPYAMAIKWSCGAAKPVLRLSSLSDDTTRGGRIAIKEATKITVTNAAPVRGQGQKHFAAYYTLLEGTVDEKHRIKLPEGSLFTGIEVYDCVPPTGGS